MGVPAYNIETLGWVEPVAVGFYDGQEYKEFLKTSEDCDVVWDFLLYLEENYPGIKLYAHNAANKENKFVLHSLFKHNQVVKFEAGLAKLKWSETSIGFEDSYLVVTRHLESFCKAFGVEQKLQWDHNKTKNIWEMVESLDAFRAYLKRDCISLSNAMGEYCKTLLSEFNILPGLSMPLTSMRIFNRNFYDVKSIHSNEKFEDFIRLATYGGRNEVFKRHGTNIFFYDINSMYVSCYDTPVPIGEMGWIRPNLDEPSLVEAIVKVPQQMLGPLPYRYNIPNTGDWRLTFPIGTFKGWWDTRELKYAVDNYNVDVKLIRQLKCYDEQPILKEYGEKICELRDASNKDLGRIWKLLGVRLCGKFGQHRITREIRHITDIKLEEFDGWIPIDDQEVYHEKQIAKNGFRTPYIKPAINMRIRAEARIRHNKKLVEARNKGQLYYCNNDSIVVDVPMYVGTKPGELKYLDYALEAWFVRCNFYCYEGRFGEIKQKTSGYHDFPLGKHDFQELLLKGEDRINRFEGIGSWREALTPAGIKLAERSRSVMGGRAFENRIADGLLTRPIKLGMKKDGTIYTKDPKPEGQK